jgi:2-amino-4-hydroxy-6-hydroxymethyldihydropteridine diphosphokinase
MATVYIGLGSNLGHSEANLEQAMRLFAPEFRIKKTSPMYETDKLYRPGKPRCLNICCRVETDCTPEQIAKVICPFPPKFDEAHLLFCVWEGTLVQENYTHHSRGRGL